MEKKFNNCFIFFRKQCESSTSTLLKCSFEVLIFYLSIPIFFHHMSEGNIVLFIPLLFKLKSLIQNINQQMNYDVIL